MNKLIVLLTGVSLLTWAHAEEKVSPLTQPILRKAADSAEWTLVTKVDKDQQVPKYRIMMQMTVTKGAKVRRIVTRWSSGQTTERWVVGSLVLSEEPGGSGIQVYDSSQPWVSPSPPPFPNYGASDFPELNWISMGNYAGVGTYQGKPCYVFQRKAAVPKLVSEKKESELKALGNAMDKAAAAQVQAVGGDATSSAVATATPAASSTAPTERVVETAYLDVNTQLPLAVTDAQVTREYSFSSQAPADPVLTPRFAEVVKSTQEALAAPYRRK